VALQFEEVLFSTHAVQRMFERRLSKEDVLSVLSHGEVIAQYPDDRPYPTCLVLGFVRSEPFTWLPQWIQPGGQP